MGETRLQGGLEEAGDGAEVGAKGAKLLHAIEPAVMRPAKNAVVINFIARLLSPPGEAAVRDGLIERL